MPQGHCPLESRRFVTLSLGDVATPATILLRPSRFLQQRATTCKTQDPQTGQEHRILGKGTHTHAHTLQGAAKFPKVCSTTNNQMIQYKCHSRPAPNLITLHWWHLIYDYSTSPRWNPSSLVNVLQSAQGCSIGPCRWHAGTATAPMPTSVRDNPM